MKSVRNANKLSIVRYLIAGAILASAASFHYRTIAEPPAAAAPNKGETQKRGGKTPPSTRSQGAV